jgi:hypothetical protein
VDYDLAQEQVKLTLAIQDARRELQELQNDKEAFLLQREQETTERVTKALQAASDAVKETSGYVASVQQMVKEANHITEEVKILRTGLQEERRAFHARCEEAREQLDAKAKELDALSITIRLEKMKLDGEVAQVQMARSALSDEQKKVDDDRGKLRAAIQIWRKQSETKTE